MDLVSTPNARLASEDLGPASAAKPNFGGWLARTVAGWAAFVAFLLFMSWAFLALTRTEFRTFVHPAAAILAPARARGLESALDTRTRMWRIVGFERARREGVNGGRTPG